VNKLLHRPLVALSRDADARELADSARRLFALDAAAAAPAAVAPARTPAHTPAHTPAPAPAQAPAGAPRAPGAAATPPAAVR
jgi:hypothetical protein